MLQTRSEIRGRKGNITDFYLIVISDVPFSAPGHVIIRSVRSNAMDMRRINISAEHAQQINGAIATWTARPRMRIARFSESDGIRDPFDWLEPEAMEGLFHRPLSISAIGTIVCVAYRRYLDVAIALDDPTGWGSR